MAGDAGILLPRRLKLIAFDWDGTLADSTAIIASCLQCACADLGIAVPTDRAALHVIGLGLADALHHVAPELPVERHSELARRFRDHYLRRDSDIPLFPGAKALLTDLQQAGYLLAVATGKSRHGLDRAMDQLGVRNHFACSRCADEGHPKPDPDMLLHVMERMIVCPGQTLMIGDTTHDLKLARNAGVAAVAVSYGAHPPENFDAFDSVPIVHSIGALRGWLEANG